MFFVGEVELTKVKNVSPELVRFWQDAFDLEKYPDVQLQVIWSREGCTARKSRSRSFEDESFRMKTGSVHLLQSETRSRSLNFSENLKIKEITVHEVFDCP